MPEQADIQADLDDTQEFDPIADEPPFEYENDPEDEDFPALDQPDHEADADELEALAEEAED